MRAAGLSGWFCSPGRRGCDPRGNGAPEAAGFSPARHCRRVLAAADTQARESSQLFPSWMQGLGLQVGNKREGERPWVSPGTRVLGSKTRYLPYYKTLPWEQMEEL